MTTNLWKYDPAKMAAEAVATEDERVATSESSVVICHPGVSKMHMRRAIKNFGMGNPEEVCWLVAQLNGVNVFISDEDGVTTVVITERDLKP